MGFLVLVTDQTIKKPTHNWLLYYFTVTLQPLCSLVQDRSVPTLDLPTRLAGMGPHSMPSQDPAFYPTSAAQLRNHLQIPSILDHHIPRALTWYQFRHRRKSRLCPQWRLGQRPPLPTIVTLWPQHLAITSYFTQLPDGTAHLLCCFTWLIHRFLNPPAV